MLARDADAAPTVLDRLVGWAVLLGGLATLGIAMLTPLVLGHRDLAWQLKVITQQADLLEQQQADYQQFHEALRDADPVLLERLAFMQLRLKPAGTDALPATIAAPLASVGPMGGGDEQDRRDASIEGWLHRPVPRVGVDVAPPPPIETHLVRLATGRARPLLLAVAVGCIALGLLLPR